MSMMEILIQLSVLKKVQFHQIVLLNTVLIMDKHGISARHLHLLEDVVVAAADEDARLADAEVAHEAEILLRRADP